MKLISVITIFSFLFFNSHKTKNISPVVSDQSDSLQSITITVVGDLMCHSPQFQYAEVIKDSFNFMPVYRNVKKYLESSDFTFGNLETVTAGKESGGYSGYPFFNTPSSYITALSETGFDLLVTSNNHSLDRGERGILKTIDEIQKRNLNYVGTYKSQQDRDSVRIFNIKGINVAILAYSYGTNGNPIPMGKDYLINLIDEKLIEKDINSSKQLRADVIIVHLHFGEEYKREPVKFQSDLVSKIIDLGGDIIIGGHPHVLQPVQFFKTNNSGLDTGFVAYSMGNFISNQRKRFTDAGLILTLKINKEPSDKFKIAEVSYIPTWVFKGNTLSGKEFVILPSTNFIDSTINLTKTDLEKMNQAFDDTRYILNKYTKIKKLKEHLD